MVIISLVEATTVAINYQLLFINKITLHSDNALSYQNPWFLSGLQLLNVQYQDDNFSPSSPIKKNTGLEDFIGGAFGINEEIFYTFHKYVQEKQNY